MSTTLPIEIIQGGSRAINIFVTDADTGAPRDLTAVTEIKATVQNSSGGCVTKLMSLSQIVVVSPATSGEFTIKFTSTDTAAMILTSAVTDPTAYVPLHLEITDPTDPDWQPKSIEVNGALNVLAKSC